MKQAKRPRVAVLISGSGTNLQAIIDAVQAGSLPIDIVGVLSDNPEAFGLERAANAGIHALAINYRAYSSRADFDVALAEALTALQPDLVVLAGYMRILPASTVDSYKGRMLNIHPSLLPAYPGLHTYRRVLEAGDSHHGTTVHYVIPELDAGPPVLQYRVAIEPGMTEPELRARVQEGEYIIYPKAIEWIATGRLDFSSGIPMLDGKPLTQPVVIDAE